MYDLVNSFSDEIKKIAKEMRAEGNMPGMPSYVLTIADRLDQVADRFLDTAWEIHMDEDL